MDYSNLLKNLDLLDDVLTRMSDGLIRRRVRREFRSRLEDFFQEKGCPLESLSFGRGVGMVGLWTLRVRFPDQRLYRKVISIGAEEPYSETTFSLLCHYANLEAMP